MHLPKGDGKKVPVCTLWRWCRLGLRGVRGHVDARVNNKDVGRRPAYVRKRTRIGPISHHHP
jgi:hypothetical protein